MRSKANREKTTLQVLQSLRRIYKTIHDSSQEIQSTFGVTLPQAWALFTLAEHGSLSLGDLSKKTYVRPSTASVVVERLNKKGYITKKRHKADQRSINIMLTSKGEELLTRIPKSNIGNLSRGIEQLDDAELKEICHALQRLTTIMEVQNLDVTFLADDEQTPATGHHKKVPSPYRG